MSTPAIYVFVFLFLVACQSGNHVKLIYPDNIYQYTEWTEDELNEDIAIRHLYRGMVSVFFRSLASA